MLQFELKELVYLFGRVNTASLLLEVAFPVALDALCCVIWLPPFPLLFLQNIIHRLVYYRSLELTWSILAQMSSIEKL